MARASLSAQHMGQRLIPCAMMLVLAACAVAPAHLAERRVAAGPTPQGSQLVSKDALVGTWQLESLVVTPTRGTAGPWAQVVSGLLTYSAEGYMAMAINTTTPRTVNDLALPSIMHYAGTYFLDGDIVVHYVINASSIDRIGKSLLRRARIHDGQLQMVAEETDRRVVSTWNKLKAVPPDGLPGL